MAEPVRPAADFKFMGCGRCEEVVQVKGKELGGLILSKESSGDRKFKSVFRDNVLRGMIHGRGPAGGFGDNFGANRGLFQDILSWRSRRWSKNQVCLLKINY